MPPTLSTNLLTESNNTMAKKDIEQPQQTMEDFLLAQLQEEVILN